MHISRAYQREPGVLFGPDLKLKGSLIFFIKIRNYVKNTEKIMTLGSCPHCPMGKVALLPVLPLSLSPTQIQF
jgi:hypothetical protein